MAASDIGIEVIILPNPQFNPAAEYAQVVNASLGFTYSDDTHFRTLSPNNPQSTDVIKGLLYVPNPSPSNGCDNATAALIPRNVTRLANFPTSEYPLIALAPWTSIDCVQAYFRAMRTDQINGAIFYHPSTSEAQPPDVDDPSWNLNDGDKWKTNPFPVYAIPGAVGALLMTTLSEYSGDMIDAPNGAELVKEYDARNFARVYAQLDTSTTDAIPSLWVFLIIVLAILLAIVLCTSLMMHIIQAKQRRSLQRRVANGEVDLEALGIKRLNVPQTLLDKMPIYVFTTKNEPTAPAAAVTNPSSSQATSATQKIREVPFSQPTCPICLDDFVHNETRVRELPCSHIFHPECIDGFLRDNSSLCPMCKKSALPPGYCPVRVTNLMVRRERLVRRMRERIIVQSEEGNGRVGPRRQMSMAMTTFGERFRRASTSGAVQRSQAMAMTRTSPQATPPAETPNPIAAVQPADEAGILRTDTNPPPEVERQGTLARRAWRRERLARQEEISYRGLQQTLEGSDDRPKWRRIMGRIVPGLS